MTEAVEHAVPDGARLAGLEFRMKSPASVCGKIRRKQEAAARAGQQVQPGEVAVGMKDVLRYSVVAADHNRLVTDAQHVADDLAARGWRVVEVENMFVAGNTYKGLHLTVQHPAGVAVEVQIHSEESLRVKEQLHGLYEQARRPGASLRQQRALQREMQGLSDELQAPPGVDALQELGGCSVREIRR